jgi:hypothetical protein
MKKLGQEWGECFEKRIFGQQKNRFCWSGSRVKKRE